MNFKKIKLGVILLGLVLGLGAGVDIKAENIKRVSIASDGTQGNSSSFQTPSINYDGTVVAFQSLASNLITNDTNDAGDIFAHDIQTGITTLVSLSSSGIQSNSSSVGPVAIDATGNLITFMSSATNFDSQDTSMNGDIYLRNRLTSETEIMSVSSEGIPGEGIPGPYWAQYPSMSSDGKIITYFSSYSNLVNDDFNERYDIFVRNNNEGITFRISKEYDGSETERDSFTPSISGDGKYVAFHTVANNLTENDINDKVDVFLYDMNTKKISRVSERPDGSDANYGASSQSINYNGEYIAIHSLSSNLVENDTNNTTDVFVVNRDTKMIERISVSSDGIEGNGVSQFPSISDNGRYIAFVSWAKNLILNDTNNKSDIFVHDRLTKKTALVSVSFENKQGNDNSLSPQISGNGEYITFISHASNLVPDDTNGVVDVFVAINPLFDENESISQCSDGVDNDGDGKIDYPNDLGCENAEDDDEYDYIQTIAIDPTNPSTLYAGTYQGVFKSINSGSSWQVINTGLNEIDIQALAIDPTNPSTLYAGTWGGGVFKSTNSGNSWQAINTGFNSTYIQTITIDPSTPSTLYVGSHRHGVFKSTNSGNSWEAIGLDDIYIKALAIDPSTPSTLYVGSYGGVYKSTDSGNSWQAINTGLTNTSIKALAIDPLIPSTLYIGTWGGGGIFKSTDSGNSWQVTNTGLINASIYILAIDPSTPSTLYAGTHQGVFRSINSGDGWEVINTGLTYTSIYTLTIDPSAPSILYIGTKQGVYKYVSDIISQCSDGIDNDGDGLIDIDDAGCHTDGDIENPASYDSNDDNETDTVLDNQAPIITLNGANPLVLYIGDTYIDPGVAVIDLDGDPVGDVIISGDEVDTSVVKTYYVIYNVFDSKGLAADEVIREVIVLAEFDPNNTMPSINLNGQSVVIIAVGREYIDLGATASDNEDGDITSKIIVSGLDKVSTNVPATYRITYNVVDSQGVPAETKVRDVVVGRYALPNSLPVITWTEELGFEDGVHPNELFVGETVTAKLIYTDEDNNYPLVYMWARGGNFGNMFQTDPTAPAYLRDNNYMNGEQLTMSLVVTYEDRYDYQFYINDYFNDTFYFPSSKQSLVVYDNTENYIPTDGTLIIKDDVTGGDCPQLGFWNSSTKTCTFTSDHVGKIFVASSNIILDGAGYTHAAHESCEGYGSVYESILTTNRTRNVEIKDFTFKTCSFYAIDTQYASEWYIHNNNFYQVDNDALSSYGIYLYGRNNIRLNDGHKVHDNNFNLPYGLGIRADYTSGFSVLRNTFTNINHAINLTGQHGKVNIEYNTISDVGRGIYVEGADPIYFDGQIFIKNNTIQRASLNGISVTRLNNSEIANNHLSNDGLNSSRSINLTDITNSTISNNTMEQIVDGGISLEGDSNIISENRISNYGHNGIYVNGTGNEISENILLTGGSENVAGIVVNGIGQQVLNNYISKENDTLHTSGYALSINGSSHIISGNYGSSDRGINLYYTDNTDIRLNSFVGITTNGLFLENSENNTIYGNKTTGSVGRGIGIYLEDSNGNTIENHFVENVREGVHLLRSKNNKLSNSTIRNSTWHPFYYEIEMPGEENFTNTIIHNNFLGYGFPPYAKMSSISPDLALGTWSGGNYWSEFDSVTEGCSNTDNDKFCDSPYYFMSNWSNTVGDMRPYARENGWNLDNPANSAPVISVIPEIVYHPEGVVFQYADKIAGVTATDPDAVIDPEDAYFHISRFTIAGEVNHLIAGEYTLSYDVSDSHGFAAETAYRIVIVEGDNPSPDPDALPIVQTGITTNITDTSVTFHGTINPNGLPAKAFFTWGETGTSQNPIPVPFIEVGEGTMSVSVSETVTGLQSDTTYLYRVIGVNVNNLVFGDYLEFTTLGGGGSDEKPGLFDIKSATAYCDTQEPVGPAIGLEWESSAGAQSYEIYRNDIKYITLLASDTTFENNIGIVVGQEYEYYIKAVNDNGETVSNNQMAVEILEGVCEVPENRPPNPPVKNSLSQGDIYNSIIEAGGILNPGDIEPAVKFSGDVSDPDGDKVKLQVELRNITDCNGTFQCDDWEPVIPDFDPISESVFVDSGSQAYAYTNVTNGKYHWRARTVDEYGAMSAWEEFGENDISEVDFIAYENFSFVHITDVHLGATTGSPATKSDNWYEYQSYPRFTDTLYEIETEVNPKPDFILIGGDNVEYNDTKWLQDFETIIDGFTRRTGIEVYVVPGNHDRREGDIFEENFMDVWRNDWLENYISVMGNPKDSNNLTSIEFLLEVYNSACPLDEPRGHNWYNYYFNHKGIQFIGLDSGEDTGKWDTSPEATGLHDDIMDSLDSLANKYPDVPRVVFIHHPIYSGELSDEFDNLIIDLDNGIVEGELVHNGSFTNHWRWFIDYCNENDVQIVLSGHNHENPVFDKDGNEINDLSGSNPDWDGEYPLFIQTQSATKDKEKDELIIYHGYRVIDIKNGKTMPQDAVSTKKDYKKVISYLNTDDNLDLDFKVNGNNVFSMTPEDITGLSTPYFIAKASKKVILYEDTQRSRFNIKNKSSSDNSEYDLLLQKRNRDIDVGDIIIGGGRIREPFGYRINNKELCKVSLFCDDFLVFHEDKEQNFTVLDFRKINMNNDSEHSLIVDWPELKIVPDSWSNVVNIEGLHFTVNNDSSTIYHYMPNLIAIDLNSPGELQAYDNNGNVTGLVNGEVKEEIPYSLYVPETETVYVFSDEGEDMADNLKTQVVGFYEDTYDLSIIVEEYGEEKGKFTANDIPTNGTTTHQFSIDWQALSQGEDGVMMEIDEDGDDVFEKTIISDATLESLIANAGESYEGIEGTEITFDASLSTDLDGNIVLYEWDFDGDGIYDESSTLPTINYIYGDDYSGEVVLMVTDDEGLTNVAIASVKITNANPEIQAYGDQTIEVLDEFMFENSFTDAGWLDTHTASIDWGDGIVENISLTEENEAPESSGEVAGSHVYNIPDTYTVTLTVTDDDEGVGINEFLVTVKKRKTELAYTGDLNGQFSDKATLQTTLTDKLGGVAAKTINFNLGGQIVSAVTNSKGVAETEITLNEIPGDYEIETSFQEDEFYLSSSNPTDFEITKDNTFLSIPNGEIVYSDDTTIQVILRDDENEFLLKQEDSQKTVYLEYFNGTEWRHITKDALNSTDDSDNTLDLYFQIPDNFDEIAGNYDLRARFSGDDYYNETTSEIGNLEVLKEDTILSDPSATVTYSDSSTLEIIFQDDDGETLFHQSDEPKTVYLEVLDGTEWKILSEDSLNSADNSDNTLTFTFEIQEGNIVDLPAGNYDLRARFDGDSRYNSTATDGTLTIVKKSVVITVENQGGFFDDTVLLKAAVLDDDEEKLYHGPYQASFMVDNHQVGEADIDENGKAEISWVVDYIPTSLSETYQIIVSFAENEYYLSGEVQGEFIAKSAKQLKQDTLAKLKTIKTDNKQAQKEIDKAIEDIENSLDSKLWTDSSRLDKQQGHKVFDREKQAVKSLLKVIEEKGKHKNPEIVAELQGIINNLAKVDILLAKIAIYDAENIEADDTDLQKKIDDEINKAKEELEKALQELTDNNSDKAIDHLKKSWKSAQLAIDFLLDKTNRWRSSFENGA